MQQTGMPPFAPPYAGLASWAWKFLKAPAGCPANPRPQRALSKAYDLCHPGCMLTQLALLCCPAVWVCRLLLV